MTSMSSSDECESSGSATMELTASFDEEEHEDSMRERLLLHWVNSLPLTTCLLVEELRDLRFGDVLYEIVEWLQHNLATPLEDELYGDEKIEKRLRRVVQFVAMECRSQDRGAIYVVNDADCVARVMAGQNDAICAVLTVLRRLCVQRMLEHQNELDALRRRRAQETLMELSLKHTRSSEGKTKENAEPRQKPKRVQASTSRSQNRVNSTKPVKNARMPDAPQRESKVVRQSRIKPTTARAKRRLGKPASRTAACAPRAVDNKKIPNQASIFHDDNGLHVFGMLDPTVKGQRRSEPSSRKNIDSRHSDDARAARFCNWARYVLHVELPLEQIFYKQSEEWKLHSPTKIRRVFTSGDLLSRIAAAIVRRYGRQLHPGTKDLSFENVAIASDPNTPASRWHNFAVALAAFKGLGISPEALASLECVQRKRKHVPPETIWCALDEVLNGVQRLAASNMKTSVDAAPETNRDGRDPYTVKNGDDQTAVISSPKHIQSPHRRKVKPVVMEITHTGCAPLKQSLPYITNEQMNAVDEWLVGVGYDVKKMASGRGVLNDPMRNGVLLCSLLAQVLKTAPFSYFKSPRTLAEMRENIAKAFERMDALPHGQIPLCYLASSAEQAVLIGDRQINYGILWHLWQVSRAKLALVKATGRKGVEFAPPDLHGTQKAEVVEQSGEQSAPVQASPLLLDIPAVALVGHGELVIKGELEKSLQVNLHDSFARRLAWSESDPKYMEDDDDVFPVPSAPFSSPVYNDISKGTHKSDMMYENMDDILPTCRDRRGPAGSFQESDGLAPKIALAELSAACADPVKVAKQSPDSDAVVPFAAKPSTADAQHNATTPLVDEILAWLKRLGIHLENASAFHDSNAPLTEFQSGVLLCCIVEKVEYMRSIPGITRPSGNHQLSKASALHNITKALTILQQKKTMPLHLLRRASAIYSGSRAVILQLLLQIRKAYGHHHPPPRRPKHHLSSAA